MLPWKYLTLDFTGVVKRLELKRDWNNHVSSLQSVSHLSSHDLYLILLGVILSANEVRAPPGLSPYTDGPVTTHSYVQTPRGLLSRPEVQPLRCGLRWEDGWMNRTLFWRSLWDWGYSPWQDVFSDLLNSSCWKKTQGCHSNGFMYDSCVKTHVSPLMCHVQYRTGG